MKKEIRKDLCAIRITVEEEGQEVGRVWLYILKNDLHTEPFGLLEDVFVVEEYRSKGIGRKLLEAGIEEAKNQKCYKLICTSRFDKEEVHAWYERHGFKKHGVEFRMDLG
jgi:GNAT superfamily N-acetyltransferase